MFVSYRFVSPPLRVSSPAGVLRGLPRAPRRPPAAGGSVRSPWRSEGLRKGGTPTPSRVGRGGAARRPCRRISVERCDEHDGVCDIPGPSPTSTSAHTLIRLLHTSLTLVSVPIDMMCTCVYVYIYIYIIYIIYIYICILKGNSCVYQGGLRNDVDVLPWQKVGRSHMALEKHTVCNVVLEQTCMLQPCMVFHHYSQLASLQLQCSTFPPHWCCVCHLCQAMPKQIPGMES